MPSPARPSGPSRPTRPEPGAGASRAERIQVEKAEVEKAEVEKAEVEKAQIEKAQIEKARVEKARVEVPAEGARVEGASIEREAAGGAAVRGATGEEVRAEAVETGEVARTADHGPLGDPVIEVRVDGPRPTPASVIARIQGQGTPAAVDGDWAQAQAEPTQAIHLVIPGHPAAGHPVTRAAAGGPGQAGPDGAFETGETIAAEPLETVGDLTGPTGPTGHGRESVVVEFARSGDAVDSASNKPVAESGLLAQAQGRVDGTFTPSQTAGRPNGLGPGRPAPAAWRKAAESVAARAAGLTGPDEPAAADQPVPAPAAKATKPRTTRTAKKAEAEPAATARTRTAKAAKPAAGAIKPAAGAIKPVAEAIKPVARRVSGKPEAAAEPRTTRAAAAQPAPSSSAAKSTTGKPVGRSANGGPARTAATGAAGTSGRGPVEAGDTAASQASYRAEAAALLAASTARRRRRTTAEPEAEPEPPAEKPRRRGPADRD